MFTKVICLVVSACVVVLAQHPPIAQFPAGVDPALCPSYPNCDNAYLHNPGQQQQQQWNAPQQNQWNAPQQNQWNQPQQPQWGQQEDDGQWRPDAAEQQWNQPQQPQWNQQPQQPQWNAPAPNAWNAPALNGPASNQLGNGGDKYPAGVNPQSCPNYPYCDTNLSAGHGAPQVQPLPGWTERVYPAGVSAHQCPNYPLCN